MSFAASLGAALTGGATYASAEQSAESLNQTLDNLLNESFSRYGKKDQKKKKKFPSHLKSLLGPKRQAGPSLLDQAAFASGIHHLATSAYTQGGLKQIFNRRPEIIEKDYFGDVNRITYGKMPNLVGNETFRQIFMPKMSEVAKVIHKNLDYYPPIQDETFERDEKTGKEKLTYREAKRTIGNEINLQKSDRIKKDILGDEYPADDPIQARKYFALSDTKVLRAGLSETEQLDGLMKDNNAEPSVLNEVLNGENMQDFDDNIIKQIKRPNSVYSDAYKILTGYEGDFVQGERSYNDIRSKGEFINEIRRYGLDFFAPAKRVEDKYEGNPKALKIKMNEYNENRKKTGKHPIKNEEKLRERTLEYLQVVENKKHLDRKKLVRSSKGKFEMLVKLINKSLDSPEEFEKKLTSLTLSDLRYVKIALKKKEYALTGTKLLDMTVDRINELELYNEAMADINDNRDDLNYVAHVVNNYMSGGKRDADLVDTVSRSIEAIMEDESEDFYKKFHAADSAEDKKKLLDDNKDILPERLRVIYQGIIDKAPTPKTAEEFNGQPVLLELEDEPLLPVEIPETPEIMENLAVVDLVENLDTVEQ